MDKLANLSEWMDENKREIADLQSRLDEAQSRRIHLVGLSQSLGGEAADGVVIGHIQASVINGGRGLRFINRETGELNEVESPVKWQVVCDLMGWEVGGDSAHRVVRRKSRDLHEMIPHNCVNDQRWYP